MPTINFTAKLFTLDSAKENSTAVLLSLPKTASAKLPSKGMTFIKGKINNSPFSAVLEPDGEGSHWFKLDSHLLKITKTKAGDSVTLEIEPSKEWPEPKTPADFKKALDNNATAQSVWLDITPMARWDWIRWIGAAKQDKTRQRRIEVACSKLNSGMRRPCCFNRSECTLTDA